MCGIVGFIDFKSVSNKNILDKMVATIHHRGPDGQGAEIYNISSALIGFGHTRLSIIDLSEGGHQPMHFQNYTILLNGEIYNFKEIRINLEKEGCSFISNSDTEVVLKAFIHWGKDCVNKFIGMFVFVILDHYGKKIFFCRDRAGVKPLYIYEDNDLLLFGSELKAFHQHPSFTKEIDLSSLSFYLRHGYVKGPNSIYKNTAKLKPGYWLEVDLMTKRKTENCYWDIVKIYQQPILNIDYQDAKQETENLLQSACEYRMVSDVPVGIFLSGGYDSSCVAAMLQKNRTEKLKTFTIGFPDGVNEAPFATEIANYLGTEHTSFDCSTKDAQEIIPQLAYYYDEPCADISTIPTMLVSKLARKKVTVALSADGGDEVFAGYNGYVLNIARWNKINSIPNLMQPILGDVINFTSNFISKDKVQLRHKLNGLAKVYKADLNEKISIFSANSTKTPDTIINDLMSTNENNQKGEHINGMNGLLGTFQYLDFTSTLTDLLLTKVDRATMSVGLEGREPLLDHRILEFASQLPDGFKHNGTKGKLILKDIVHQYIPESIMDRPKMGFDLPIFTWLKNDLNYLVEEYLSEEELNKHKLFNYNSVKQIVYLFNEDKLVYKDIIWRLIHFQMWYNQWQIKK